MSQISQEMSFLRSVSAQVVPAMPLPMMTYLRLRLAATANSLVTAVAARDHGAGTSIHMQVLCAKIVMPYDYRLRHLSMPRPAIESFRSGRRPRYDSAPPSPAHTQ